MSEKIHSMDVVAIRLVKESKLLSAEPIDSPQAVLKVFGERLKEMDRECVAIVCLKTNGQPICCHICSMGALDFCMVHPREIFKAAILANAHRIILIHNHPSSNLTPSQEDIRITDQLLQAGKLLGIEVIDHVIMAPETNNYFSFREKSILPEGRMTYTGDLYELKFPELKAAEDMPAKTQRKRR